MYEYIEASPQMQNPGGFICGQRLDPGYMGVAMIGILCGNCPVLFLLPHSNGNGFQDQMGPPK